MSIFYLYTTNVLLTSRFWHVLKTSQLVFFGRENSGSQRPNMPCLTEICFRFNHKYTYFIWQRYYNSGAVSVGPRAQEISYICWISSCNSELCDVAVVALLHNVPHVSDWHLEADRPLSPLPLDHPDQHPPLPVSPQHVLNLLVCEAVDNTYHKTLNINFAKCGMSDKTTHIQGMIDASFQKLA